MSEPVPEAPSGGGFMSKKFLGLPAIVWLLGAVLLAFLFFRNKSGSTTGATSTAGSGQSTTGDISIAPGTTSYTVAAQYGPNTTTATQTTPPRHGTTNPQPTPSPKPTTKKNQASVTTYTVKPGDTLASLSQKLLGTSNRTALAHANGLGTGAGLKTGQVLKVPAHG